MNSFKTELFEIELIICIKMDLALNNRQRCIFLKTRTKNQTISLQIHLTSAFNPNKYYPSGLSVPGSNGNKVIHHTLHCSKTEASPPDEANSNTRNLSSYGAGLVPLNMM